MYQFSNCKIILLVYGSANGWPHIRHLRKCILFTEEGRGAQYSRLRQWATIFEVPGSIPGKDRGNFQVTYRLHVFLVSPILATCQPPTSGSRLKGEIWSLQTVLRCFHSLYPRSCLYVIPRHNYGDDILLLQFLHKSANLKHFICFIDIQIMNQIHLNYSTASNRSFIVHGSVQQLFHWIYDWHTRDSWSVPAIR